MRSIVENWVVNREWWRGPDPVPAQPGLEFWRVEAAAGQGLSAGTYFTGTYELRRDAAAGAWTLLRVAD